MEPGHQHPEVGDTDMAALRGAPALRGGAVMHLADEEPQRRVLPFSGAIRKMHWGGQLGVAAPSAFLDTWTAVSAELVACARRWAQAWDGVLLRKQVERLNWSCISLPFRLMLICFSSISHYFCRHFSVRQKAVL